MDLNHVNRVL